MKRSILIYILAIGITLGVVYAQESTEIQELREEIKLLRKKVEALEKEQKTGKTQASQDKVLSREVEALEKEQTSDKTQAQQQDKVLSPEERKSLITDILEAVRIDLSAQTSEEKDLETLYDDGYVFKGKDDLLRIGGWLQADVRMFEPDHPGDTTFTIRRARLDMRGSLEFDFSYRLYLGFDGGRASVVEAWLSYDRFPFARFKVGQFVEPFSLEGIGSSRWLALIERSIIVASFSPQEDIGIMLYGTFLDKKVTYAIGLFNGRGRPPAIVPDEDNNDDSDLVARLEVNPFAGSIDMEWVKNLYVGVGATIGNQEDLNPTVFRTAPRTIFLQYVANTQMDGERHRFEADMEWIIGPASIKIEWLMTRYEEIFVGTKGITFNADFYGWYVTATYLLTGENKPRNKPVKPRANFNPTLNQWGWGAWEMAARYDQFNGERDLITKGFASGTDRVDTITLGLNWYPNHHIKIAFNYIYSSFDDDIIVSGKSLNHENTFLLRFQANF